MAVVIAAEPTSCALRAIVQPNVTSTTARAFSHIADIMGKISLYPMSLTPISHLHSEVVELYEEIGSYLGVANKLYERHPTWPSPTSFAAT